MKFFNLTLVGKWLTLCCLLLTLGLSGCSGSLNSDSDTSGSTTNNGSTDGSGGTGGTDGTDPDPQPGPLAPTKPTVVDRITTKQGQDVNITGTCTKNANQVNQTDFIRVSISFDGGAEKTETTLCNDDGTWNKNFEGSLFDRDAIGVIKAVSVNRDELIPDSDPGYGLIDVGGVDIVDDQPKPVTPSVQEQTVSEFDPVLIQGSCVANGVQGTSLDTNLISVSINGKSQTAICQDSGAWVVKWNEKIEPGVYPIVAYAENIKDQSSSVPSEKALNILYVNSVALVIVPSLGQETLPSNEVINVTAKTVDSGEIINIAVTFADANKENGTFSSGNVEINFRSDCIGAGLAVVEDQAGTPQTQFTSNNARISANYKTDGCVGTDSIVVEGTFEGESVVALEPLVITINPDDVHQLNFVSKSETDLVTKGNTGVQVSEVVFELIGKKGAKVVGEKVTFSLESTHGSLELSSDEETSDNNGQVRVSVRSGTTHSVIQVVATHEETGQSAKSGDIAAYRKLTSANNFNISVDKPSPLSYNRSNDGNISPVTITATVNDRYGWPVIDGTVVQFAVESTHRIDSVNFQEGAIGIFGEGKTCETVKGVCQVKWYPNGNNAHDGYVTIFAYAKGEEDFVEDNGNGYWDSGEDYFDLPEPYLDHTRVWQWNSEGDQEKTDTAYSIGNFWWNDLDNDGVRDEANGPDKEYNGLTCTDEGVCTTSFVYIKAEEVIHQASRFVDVCQDFTEMPTNNTKKTLAANQSISLTGLILCDSENSIDKTSRNGQSQIPTGTIIKFEATGGVIDQGAETTVIGDQFLPNTRRIRFTAGQELRDAVITATATIPEGDPNGGGEVVQSVGTWVVSVIATPSFIPSKPSVNSDDKQKFIEKNDPQAALSGTCPLYSHYDPNGDGNDDVHVATKHLKYFETNSGITKTFSCVEPTIDPAEPIDYYADGTWTFQLDGAAGLIDSEGQKDFQITLVTMESSEVPLKTDETASSYESSSDSAIVYVYEVPDEAEVDQSINYISNGGVVALQGTCNEGNTTHVEVIANGNTVEVVCNKENPIGQWTAEVSLGVGQHDVEVKAVNKTFSLQLPEEEYYMTSSDPVNITIN